MTRILRYDPLLMELGRSPSPRVAGAFVVGCLLSACSRGEVEKRVDAGPVEEAASAAATIPSAPEPSASAESIVASPCPPEMLRLEQPSPVCVDRWEAILVDKKSGTRLSPYFPVDRKLAARLASDWESKRLSLGSAQARAMALPELPAWQRDNTPEPMAVSKPGQIPNGYLSGTVARRACENAGKRLCTRQEWVGACRGDAGRTFPYGDRYRPGVCNVFRATHPAAFLHGDASMGHLDPRLLLVRDQDGPLLRRTGETEACKSQWGSDGLYDMVGNLDEWVDDPQGMFVGAFFARSKKDGCESVVRSHPNEYFDYSLGVRCCK